MWLYECFKTIIQNRISTHTSLAGCDILSMRIRILLLYFYSHIPRGMWLCHDNTSLALFVFLLTHPSRDVTFHNSSNFCAHFWFLLTHPSRDVTNTAFSCKSRSLVISTHTSLAGCDELYSQFPPSSRYFYSHIPRGMWRISGIHSKFLNWFLLTHPSRDVTETEKCHIILPVRHFYSHIPRGMWPDA